MKQKNREVNPQNITNSGGSIFRVYDMGRWKVKLEKYSFCERKPFAGGQNVCHLWQAVYMEEEMGKVLVGNNHM